MTPFWFLSAEHRPSGAAARLFGYDAFISFALGPAPRGTRGYASDLARRLRERGITVFFSEDEAPPGQPLSQTLRRALFRSRLLIVVANAGTLIEPRWVRLETEEFRRRHPRRSIVPISIGRALQEHGTEFDVGAWLPYEDAIWIDEEAGADGTGIVGDNVIERLATAPHALRVGARLRAVVATVITLLVILAGVAWVQRGIALRNAALAESRELAARSSERLANDDAIAALDLAIAALRKADSAEARRAVAAAMEESRALVLLPHGPGLHTARLLDNDRRAVTAGPESVRFWDVATGKLAYELPGENLLAAAVSDNGHMLITCERGKARLVDTTTGEVRRVFDHHGNQVLFAAFSPNLQTLVTTSGASAYLWNVDREAPLAEMWGHQGIVYHAAFSPNGERLATTGGDSYTALLWDISRIVGAGKVTPNDSLGSVDTGGRAVSVAFSPDGQWLVTASHREGARAWRTEQITRAERSKPTILHPGPVVPLIFARRDVLATRLATGGVDGIVRIYAVEPERFEQLAALTATRLPADVLEHKLSGFEDFATISTSVEFDRTGNWLLTADAAGAVKLWAAVPGTVITPERWNLTMRLKGHRDRVRTASFGTATDRIVTAGSDGTAIVWDASPRSSGIGSSDRPVSAIVAQAEHRRPRNVRPSKY